MYGIIVSCMFFYSSILCGAGAGAVSSVRPALPTALPKKITDAPIARALLGQVTKAIYCIQKSHSSSSPLPRTFEAPDNAGINLTLQSNDAYYNITASCVGRTEEEHLMDNLRTQIFSVLSKQISTPIYDSKTRDEHICLDSRVKVSKCVLGKDGGWCAILSLTCYQIELHKALTKLERKEAA